MAFVPADANKVWQEAGIALDALAANSFSRDAFRALKAYLSQVKRLPSLQIIQFTEVQADAAGGTAILTGACTLYGVFVKKENEGTDNLFLVYDDATNDTTDANVIDAASLKTAKEEAFIAHPNGMVIATGLLVTQYTSASGLGKADGSNGGNGFVIIGPS